MSIRSLIIIILLTLAAIVLWHEDGLAQQPEGSPDSTRIGAIVDSLAQHLQLTDSVKAEVFSIYYESAAETREVLVQGKRNLRTMRKLQGIAKKRDEEVRKLLTEEQQKEYEKIVAEKREEMKERIQNRKRGY